VIGAELSSGIGQTDAEKTNQALYWESAVSPHISLYKQ
jgi:hypothetical protein